MKTPSSLNRILDSSWTLMMGSQGPKVFSREQPILLKQTALGECVITLFLSCSGSHVTVIT